MVVVLGYDMKRKEEESLSKRGKGGEQGCENMVRSWAFFFYITSLSPTQEVMAFTFILYMPLFISCL